MKSDSYEILIALASYMTSKFRKFLSDKFGIMDDEKIAFVLDDSISYHSRLICRCDYIDLDVCVDNHVEDSLCSLQPMVISLSSNGNKRLECYDAILRRVMTVLAGEESDCRVLVDACDRERWIYLDISDMRCSSISELKMKLAIRGFL